jgi:hypothetical protein
MDCSEPVLVSVVLDVYFPAFSDTVANKKRIILQHQTRITQYDTWFGRLSSTLRRHGAVESMPSVWCAGEGQAGNPSVVAQAPDRRIALWKAAVAGPASVLWDKVRDVVCSDRKRWRHRDWAGEGFRTLVESP